MVHQPGAGRLVGKILGCGVRHGFQIDEPLLQAERALRSEVQFPLGLPEEYGITGGLFADAGSVWGLDNTTGAYGE